MTMDVSRSGLKSSKKGYVREGCVKCESNFLMILLAVGKDGGGLDETVDELKFSLASMERGERPTLSDIYITKHFHHLTPCVIIT